MNIRNLISHCHLWLTDFITTLFDFSFGQTITTRMLPLLYGLGIIAIVTVFGYFGFLAFMDHWLKGLVYSTLFAPVGIIFGITIVRIFLEFFSAVFTMLKALRNTLASISRLEHTFEMAHDDITAIRRRFTAMTLTLENVESSLARMESILVEIDQIATKIPFLKTRKSSKPSKTEGDTVARSENRTAQKNQQDQDSH